MEIDLDVCKLTPVVKPQMRKHYLNRLIIRVQQSRDDNARAHYSSQQPQFIMMWVDVVR
jgi:hypothetical protein